MRLTGFRTYDWEADKYWVSSDDNAMLVNSVEPQILTRPGAYPTFGIAVVGAMYLPGEVGYNGPLTLEAAFLNFFKRLNPADTTPGELRAVRNDGTAIKILAALSIPTYSATSEVNTKTIQFICCQPFWLATGYSTGTGGFQ